MGKKPSLTSDSGIHAITPSVVNFTSLFSNKPFLKLGAVTAPDKHCQVAESLSSSFQSKPLKKEKEENLGGLKWWQEAHAGLQKD